MHDNTYRVQRRPLEVCDRNSFVSEQQRRTRNQDRGNAAKGREETANSPNVMSVNGQMDTAPST